MSPSDRAPQRGGSETLNWPAIGRYFQQSSPRTKLVPLPERSLIYVKNPKAGSSTLMVWLDRIHTGQADAPTHMHRDSRLPTVRDVGRRQVVRMLAGEAYRFSFVRDPARRLESVYWAKMFRDMRFRRRVTPELDLPPDLDEHVSFDRFLTAIEGQDPLTEMNSHWRPQHLNLLHPLVTYDHVGRLESFESDIARIREEAGLPDVPVESMNVAPQQVRDSVYDGRPDLRRRVEQLYARDMELFDY